ncbi:MAG: hypothetical protein EXS16_10310 [Gemmataceae bacterium]|nr:hypothetical protein [Gemmataceae bacterium]
MNNDAPRWLHAIAVTTVICTLPLLFLGASVTSHGVGMVDPKGFRPPWVVINTLFEDSRFAWRLEYGHRTFGFLVGICGIVFALGCWFFDRRSWMGWMGFLMLAMICLQGMLGIFRVDLNSQFPIAFKLMHGIFAQLVFATIVTVMLFTSNRWASLGVTNGSPALRRATLITVAIVFVQLVLGAMVRHHESLFGPRGHLFSAFLTTGAIVWLLILMRNEDGSMFRLERVSLMGLLTLQLVLGVESWLARFHVIGSNLPQLAPAPTHAEWIRTIHYLVGTLIFATTASAAWIAHRGLFANAATMPNPNIAGANSESPTVGAAL